MKVQTPSVVVRRHLEVTALKWAAVLAQTKLLGPLRLSEPARPDRTADAQIVLGLASRLLGLLGFGELVVVRGHLGFVDRFHWRTAIFGRRT